MPVVLQSTGGGQITLDVPSTASNFTITLPATTGTAALTSQISVGSTTILGTISTASGASASLGSLVLTYYKVIQLWILGVSSSSSFGLLVGNSTADDVNVLSSTAVSSANTVNGIVTIDLSDGVGVSSVTDSGGAVLNTNFDTALSTSSTTISVAPSAGNFDAGSIRVVGFK